MEEHVPAVTPELPSRSWRVLLRLLRVLPQASLSRSLGQLADLPVPRPLRVPVLGTAARALGMDLGEAALPLEEYGSLNALFVRELRPGVRPVDRAPGTAVSPVDGIVGQRGEVREGRAVQAKGRDYGIGALLAEDALAARFRDGCFLTIYLSPRHYHRIHAPVGGRVVRARYVPGALWPVNEPAVLHVPDLFPRNERLVAFIEGELGLCALVAVGAYNVGRISARFDAEWRAPGWASNRKGAVASARNYEPAPAVERGEELMAFHLGSTVVLLFERGARLDPALRPGAELRLGQAIARRVSA